MLGPKSCLLRFQPMSSERAYRHTDAAHRAAADLLIGMLHMFAAGLRIEQIRPAAARGIRFAGDGGGGAGLDTAHASSAAR